MSINGEEGPWHVESAVLTSLSGPPVWKETRPRRNKKRVLAAMKPRRATRAMDRGLIVQMPMSRIQMYYREMQMSFSWKSPGDRAGHAESEGEGNQEF
jgi:hypothetical protein